MSQSTAYFVTSTQLTDAVREREIDKIKTISNVIESLLEREPQILMVGRYIDQLVRDAAGFKFKHRSCVYDNYRVRTTLVIPV